MPREFIPALIAFAGVFLSLVISYVTSTRQANIETGKLRTEIEQKFGYKLFEKRLEVYPELYRYLSDFIKEIQFGKVDHSALERFFSQFLEWDSRYSIFFSGSTGEIVYKFRLQIAELMTKTNNELEELYSTSNSLRELRHSVQELELCLKNELGIYAFESPTEVKNFKRFRSYQEVTENVSKSKS